MGMTTSIETIATSIQAIAESMETASSNMDVTAVVSIIGATVSALSALIAYFMAMRKMYVDVVIKERLDAIAERRHSLRCLCYYTDPNTIKLTLQNNTRSEHIQSLLSTQSALEYRLMMALYPDSEVVEKAQDLVSLAIKYLNSGDAPSEYETKRRECLELQKIYHFASWQYAQKHSTGRRGSSIDGFDATFVKTLKLLKQKDKYTDGMKNLLEDIYREPCKEAAGDP